MKAKVFITIGIMMILIAFGLTGFNFYQDKQAENFANVVSEEIHEVIQNNESEWKDTYEEAPNMEMPVVKKNGFYYIGTLDIPRFKLSLPIMSECSNRNLYVSPCRYYGSIYTDDMVLAGHNYRSHFGKIRKLKKHNEIIFTDMDGNVFKYEVVDIEILHPTQVEEMIESEYDLSLYTCTLPGNKRITVRCIKVD